MGKTVSGKSPEVLTVFSKDSLLNLEHFDTNLKGAADCRKKFRIKNRPKIENSKNYDYYVTSSDDVIVTFYHHF